MIQSKTSDHGEIKLETINRKISGKFQNIWKLINILLYNLRVKEVKRENSKQFELNEDNILEVVEFH